eukprot:Skav210950  [mRNA]  locus=scaffold713:302670:306171:+ [translate_table: standard]
MPLAAAAALVIAGTPEQFLTLFDKGYNEALTKIDKPMILGVSLAILVGTTLRAQAAFATAARAELRRAAERSEARRLEDAIAHEARRVARDGDVTEATATPSVSPTALSEGRGVHYPAHVESVKVLRPDLEPVSLEGWFRKNHEPGVSCYLKSLFNDELMEEEHKIWVKAMEDKVPSFYEGMAELLREFRASGGRVAVVSHSPADVIQRHYDAHPWAHQIQPDLVLGWDQDSIQRYPVGTVFKV